MYRAVEVSAFVVFALVSAGAHADPVGRIYHSLLTLNDGSLLMLGGVSRHGFGPMDLRDTWLYDVDSHSWQLVGDLEAGDVTGAAYDKQSNKVITLNYAGETWAFDPSGGEWERKSPAIGPSGRCGHGMAYDAKSDRVILFGGFACTAAADPLLSDTWSYDYDADAWTQHSSESVPPPRIYHSMVYHDVADRVVLWGGRVEDSKVWTFDLEESAWTALTQDSFPEGVRAYQSMGYDPDSGRIFMFGGLLLTEPMSFEGELVDELWIYDLSTNEWSFHESNDGPSARSHHAMTTTRRGNFVVFGGELHTPYSDEMSDEMWVLDPDSVSWSRMPSQ